MEKERKRSLLPENFIEKIAVNEEPLDGNINTSDESRGRTTESEASAEDRGAEVAQRLPISQKLTEEKAEPRYSFQDLPFFVDDEGDVYHALIPIIKENLEIQKQLYNGERGNHIVLGHGVSKESNDPQQEQERSRGYNRRGNRPLESQSRVLGGDREGEISAEDRGGEVAQRLSISQKLTEEKAETRHSFQDLPFFVDDEGEVFYFNDDTEVTDRPRNVQLLHYNLGELVPRSGVTG